MKTPHKCPVCDGRGLVPDWFYLTQPGGTPTSSGVGDVTCRSCNGSGIVWGGPDQIDTPTLKKLGDQS